MAGGLERNITRIANYLAARGHDVSLISFDLPDAISFYPINENVVWHKVGRTAPHAAISFADRIGLLKRMREALTGNPTIIAFHHGLLPRLMLAGFGLKKRIITSERSALSMYKHVRASKWNVSFFLMAFASKIIVQFDSYKRDYPLFMRSKIHAIPNVVEKATQFAMPDVPSTDGRFKILAVGRLCDQKNYSALIAAFSNLADQFPDWDVVIVGSGESEKLLRAQVKDLNLASRVIFISAASDVEKYYLQSHIYAMPSKWEGFPNALAEALAHGLPSIGYTGCDGVANLIKQGENGALAEGNGDVSSLARALESVMQYPFTRVRMGQAAITSVAGYAAENIYLQWEKLLEDF